MLPDHTMIRRASAADLPAVHALLERYFNDWSIWERDDPGTLLAIMDNEPQLGFYVAENAGLILGCLLCHTLPQFPGATECKRMYVVPEARRQGLGGRLLEAAERDAAAAGARWMYLDSTEEFATALNLYRRRGYQPCERFNNNPQATLFFRKPLD